MTDDALALTVEAAARRIGMSRGALYPLVMSGEIPSMKIGRARRVPVAALEAWVERQMASNSGGGAHTEHPAQRR